MRRLLLLTVFVAACASGTAGAPDASHGSPDGAGAPDASHAPDAAIPIDAAVPIDATPPIDACVPSAQQVLNNGNLDSSPLGISWTQLPQDPTYPPVVTATDMQPTGIAPDSPSNAIWLGGLLSSTDALYQQVAIPAGATGVQITGKKYFVTDPTNTTAHDFLKVQIRSTSDTVLETVVTWSNLDTNSSWTSFTLTPTGNYAGQTVRLYFQSQTDATLNTNFFLDTLALNLSACP